MARTHGSYDRGKQLYPFAKHALVPDIAFQLGPYYYHDDDSSSAMNDNVDAAAPPSKIDIYF